MSRPWYIAGRWVQAVIIAAAAIAIYECCRRNSTVSFDPVARQKVASALILRLNKEYMPWRNSLPQTAFSLKARSGDGDWRTVTIFPDSRVDMLTIAVARGLPNGVLINVAIPGRQSDQLFIGPDDQWEFTR